MTSGNCRVALLLNFIPPYRVAVLRALRAEVGEMRIFLSTAVEANRPWPAEWADLPVVVQRSVSVQKRWKRPGGFGDVTYVHFPYDTLAQLRRFRPDVIVSGELGLRSWLAAAYKRRFPGVRLVLWATVSERTEQWRGFLREWLRPTLLKQADAVLVNGASGARYITAQGVPEELLSRVPYTADVATFSAAPLEMPREDVVCLLYVGLLIPRKGVLGFLRTLATWAAVHPQRIIEFRIAGDGPERAALEAVKCPQNLRVRFLGNVAYQTLPKVYGASSMLAMPTLEDEWGVVINEAMAAGLPILGSRYSQAVEELVTEGETGWTFAPDDQGSVLAALDAALEAPAVQRARMGLTARMHALALTPQRVAHEITRAIDRVLAPREAPKTDPVAAEQVRDDEVETSSTPPHALPRVIVFAYACEPGHGSEPEAGWGIVQALSRQARCVVLVGSAHIPAIRAKERLAAASATEFVEVPDGWRRDGPRRGRIAWFIAYLRWATKAASIARALHNASPFDAVYHLTYSAYWLPSPALSLGIPLIWGPVGGAVVAPRALWRLLGWKGLATELVDLLAVRLAALWRPTRRLWREAKVVLVQNEATLRRLPRDVRRNARVLNHALFTEVPRITPNLHDACVFIGALESRKAPGLAIQALQFAPESVRLLIIGDGPDRGALERLGRRIGVAHRVEFRGAMRRTAALSLLAGARAVVFTGVREEGGIALAEAMVLGIPVIVLDHGGAGTIARAATDPSGVTLIRPDKGANMARAIAAAMARYSASVGRRQTSLLDADSATRQLHAALTDALSRRALSAFESAVPRSNGTADPVNGSPHLRPDCSASTHPR